MGNFAPADGFVIIIRTTHGDFIHFTSQSQDSIRAFMAKLYESLEKEMTISLETTDGEIALYNPAFVVAIVTHSVKQGEAY